MQILGRFVRSIRHGTCIVLIDWIQFVLVLLFFRVVSCRRRGSKMYNHLS